MPVTVAASPMHVYEVRPRKNHRGVDLISDALPFGRLWYGEPNEASNAIDYAKFRSRSHDAVIRVYDVTGDMIETHEHRDVKELGERNDGSLACWFVAVPQSKPQVPREKSRYYDLS